jgi:hypothetical protein
LTREVEIKPVDGASNVINGLRILRNMERLTCLGVFDGNERQKVGNRQSASDDSVLFLPGRMCPEEEVLTNALKKPQWIAGITNTSIDNVVAAVGSAQDVDHQYQIRRVARQLGLSETTLTDWLVQAWLRQPKIAREAEQLATNIRRALSKDTS